MWEHSSAIVAACALAFSIATTVLGLLQRLSTSQIKVELAAAELKLSKAIADSKNEIDDRIDRQGRDFGERIDRQGRDFGEVAIALRNKIHEVEMWSRDNFVRRDNFYKMSEDLTASIGKLGDKIESRLERMEEKIDNKQTKAES